MAGLLGLFRVSGNSMVPAFTHGDYVLTHRFGLGGPGVGDVVVVDHPVLGTVIKRIQSVSSTGNLKLAGDNRIESTAAEKLGSVSPDRVLGKVWCRIARPAPKHDTGDGRRRVLPGNSA